MIHGYNFLCTHSAYHQVEKQSGGSLTNNYCLFADDIREPFTGVNDGSQLLSQYQLFMSFSFRQRQQVFDFVDTAPRSDDLTMLAVQRVV